MSSGSGDKRAAEQEKGRFLRNQVSARSWGGLSPSCIVRNRFSSNQLLVSFPFPGFIPHSPSMGGMLQHHLTCGDTSATTAVRC